MSDRLPNSVRYIKNGRSSRWWQTARKNGEVHAGWSIVPPELMRSRDFAKIERCVKKSFRSKPGATQDFNALRDLLDKPSQHIWITFQDGFMWWCTVYDKITINPRGQSQEKGHFWLTCYRPWAKTSIKGRQLAITDLPGTVTATAGFRATVCEPKDSAAIIRLIKGEQNTDAAHSRMRRHEYEQAVEKVVKRLSPRDFEHLIDIILARTGWERVSTLGGTREGIDIEAENPTVNETAFVQVKSTAGERDLKDYVKRFSKQRDRYARMIFAVHSPRGILEPPPNLPVQVWTSTQIAELVVQLGLGNWVEKKIA